MGKETAASLVPGKGGLMASTGVQGSEFKSPPPSLYTVAFLRD